jgi:HK97 gp10 family phage protein
MARDRSMIDVRGTRRLRRDLRRLGDNAQEVRTEATKRWARAVEADASQHAPVDTGRLKDAIDSRWDADGAEVGVWDRDAWYATFVEHGTSVMPARPFLLPAAQRAPDPAGFMAAELERRAQQQ